MKTLYKSLPADMKPNGHKFVVGKWYKENNIKICHAGFHASKRAIEAMNYVNCEVLAKVEVRGKSIIEKDKECWSEMKIVKTYKWTKNDSVSLAIYVAELVIDLFEKKYPKDKRPREAIEAAKKYLKNPTDKNAAAAWAAAETANAAAWAAAWAADKAAKAAAEAAAEAAWAADKAAKAAAEAAKAAAKAAAWAAKAAAKAAAWAAKAAAWAAEYEKTLDKIEKWIQKRVNLTKERKN